MTQAVARRIRPLLVILGLGALVLLARLVEVQVREHEVWAEEAARLVHSGKELPYERGRILDTKGRVLARDKQTFHLVLTYRDFRRGHPLGQVAHARSLLENRPVPIQEAYARVFDWARELVQLSPRALADFASGGELTTATLAAPAFPKHERGRRARAENRAGRAKDVSFYVRRLFPLADAELRAMEKAAREEGDRKDGSGRSYLELAAGVMEERPAPATLWKVVERRIQRTLDRLDGMASLLEWSEDASARPLDFLLAELEDTRRWVEDATAAKLFAEAAGFVPGRVAKDTLVTRIDLSWIARQLGWDDERLFAWARTTREGWETTWRDGYALPRLIAGLRLEPAVRPEPDEYLARVASLFLPNEALEAALDGELPDWRDPEELRELVVLGRLDELFEARLPRDSPWNSRARPAVLPLERAGFGEIDARLRERWETDKDELHARFARASGQKDPAKREEQEKLARRAEAERRGTYWSLVDAAWTANGLGGFELPEELGPAGVTPGARLRELFDSPVWSAPDDIKELTGILVREWDLELQSAIRQALDELLANADEDELENGRLVMREDLRSRAAERAEFFLKDYGRRMKPLVRGEPSYDVLYLIARYGEDFCGFEAREAREREYPVLPGDEARIAPGLVGSVSAVGVDDVVAQRSEAERLRELKSIPEKTDEERLELESLVGRVLTTDQVKGVVGVEGYWNRELTGRNGYEESRGLEDVYGDGRADTVRTPRVDGLDLTLTLDADLQRACTRTLRSGAGFEDPESDREWYESPVGAAVIVSIEGDVLAAASEPDSLERTLRIPTFQPPGSVFKPFVAAYARSKVRLDWRTTACADIGDGHAGWKDVHCASTYGHGEVEMERALVVSCNSFFAHLGESLSDDDLRQAARLFGFDERTGLLRAPPWDDGIRARSGFVEHVGGMRGPLPGSFGEHGRRLAGNGLGVVETTPLQLARGFVGLATGELRELRLVRRVGARDAPHGTRTPIELDPAALEFVRDALRQVVNSDDAQRTGRVLGREHLGYDVAAKTGSADLATGKRLLHDVLRVPKHTWVAGWAPARDPELVFVVFVHDTLATASHGAVYLARELLRQPEVLVHLREAGVDVSAVPAR